MTRIYKRERYVIYHSGDCGYILQNILMPDFSHTHLDSMEQCKLLIHLSLHQKVPHHLSRYLLESLVRINDNEDFIQKVEELMKAKERKKQDYVNRR